MAPTVTLQTTHDPQDSPAETSRGDEDAGSLLEAIAHGENTIGDDPYADSLFIAPRRLPVKVTERLQQIDAECSEQIDRFGLIFQAAELQRQPEVLHSWPEQTLARCCFFSPRVGNNS